MKKNILKTAKLFLVFFIFYSLLTSCSSISSYLYKVAVAYEPNDRVIVQKEETSKVTKLPDKINSNSSESNPVISADGKLLYFSRSNGSNLFNFKIYTAEIENNSIKDPFILPNPPNFDSQNYIGSSTSDMQKIVFSANPAVTTKSNVSPIYMAEKKDGKWVISDTITFFDGKKGWGFNIQTNKYDIESNVMLSYPQISSDGTKLLFSSNVIGGFGVTDLYISELQDNKWTEPKNLGDKINTKEIEISPFLHPDNKTLFFISNGHPGIGKLDVFKSTLNNGNWSKPELLGYPFSSKEVETAFSLSANGETAYFASDRDNPGNNDIFMSVLNDVDKKVNNVVLFSGKIINGLTNEPLEAKIIIEDLKNSKQIAVLQSDYHTGNYFIALPKCETYSLTAEKKNYTFYSNQFELTNNSSDKVINMDIVLYPIEKGTTLTLNNVFFDYNSDKLKPESKLELMRAVTILKSIKDFFIEVSGHTDNVGKENYNLQLSEKRAKAVVNFLIDNGIPKNKMTFKGYGLTKPKVSNDTEEGRKINRRVEIIFN